jgi:hypothetical protein
VAVPAGIAAAFEVVEPEAVFEFSVVVLDSPADLRESDKFPQGVSGGMVESQ